MVTGSTAAVGGNHFHFNSIPSYFSRIFFRGSQGQAVKTIMGSVTNSELLGISARYCFRGSKKNINTTSRAETRPRKWRFTCHGGDLKSGCTTALKRWTAIRYVLTYYNRLYGTIHDIYVPRPPDRLSIGLASSHPYNYRGPST